MQQCNATMLCTGGGSPTALRCLLRTVRVSCQAKYAGVLRGTGVGEPPGAGAAGCGGGGGAPGTGVGAGCAEAMRGLPGEPAGGAASSGGVAASVACTLPSPFLPPWNRPPRWRPPSAPPPPPAVAGFLLPAAATGGGQAGGWMSV